METMHSISISTDKTTGLNYLDELFLLRSTESISDFFAASTLVLMLGIPLQLTEDAFLAFVEPYLSSFQQHELIPSIANSHSDSNSQSQMIARDPRLTRQNALISFSNPKYAQSFIEVYNNLHFPEFPDASPTLVFPVFIGPTFSIFSSNVQVQPLPTCTVCLRRISHTASKIPASDVFPVNSGYSGNLDYCKTCNLYGTHLEFERCQEFEEYNGAPLAKAECNTCCVGENLWLCLVCSHAGCGRYTKQHAELHFQRTRHSFALELVTGRIWDYSHDTFVHFVDENEAVRADGNAQYTSEDRESLKSDDRDEKWDHTISPSFEVDKIPISSPTTLNFLYAQPRQRIRRAPPSLDNSVNRKIISVQSEYEGLLESQLEAQRLFFEKVLAQETVRALELALCGTISDSTSPLSDMDLNAATSAIEKSKIEISSLESEYSATLESLRQVESEVRKMRKSNDALIREQKTLKDREAELKQRKSHVVQKAEERMTDLQQQITDLSFFVNTRKQVEGGALEGGSIVVRGGTARESRNIDKNSSKKNPSKK